MTLKMTTAQVVETSVTVTNSSFQNYTHPDDHATRTTDTPGFKPFTTNTKSYPFTFEPRRPLYFPVSSNTISEMRFYVTDSLGRPVDFNGIDWFMTLLLHSK